MSQIVYQFTATGHQSVEKAFLGIEAAAKRSAKTVERAYTGEERAAKRTASEQERAARRAADVEAREAARAERAKVRSAQNEARERARAVQYVQRIRDKHFADQQRQEERAAAKQTRLSEMVARQRAKSEQRSREHEVKETQRAEQRKARERQRAEEHVARIRDRHFAAEQRANERVAEARRRSLGRIQGEIRGMTIGGAAGALALGAGVAGGAVKDAYALQATANRLSINSRKSGQDFVNATTLRKEFEATALATNGAVKAEDVGQGISSFVSKTGRLDLARKMSGTFATTAAATGASFQDVASAGAELMKKMKIETAEEMQQAMAAIAFGGKEGAFELADAASKYAKLASAGATFGLDKGVGGVKVLQGLSQIAMDSTGDRDVATTAVEAMFRQVVTRSEKLKNKFGVDVFTDDSNTKARPIEKLLPEIMAATGGDKVALQGIFGDEGKRAVNPLIDTYTTAYQSAKGKGGKKATEAERVAAGKAAVTAQLQSTINAPGTWADMKLDAEQAIDGPAKIAAAWERLTASVGDKLLPILDRMINRFEVSEEAIDKFVGTIGVLLELVEKAGVATGLLKDVEKDPALEQQRAQKVVDRTTTELAALPSEKRVQELTTAGLTELARQEQEKLDSPEVKAKRAKLEAEKRAAEGKLGKLEEVDRVSRALRTPEEFEALYLEKGTDDDSRSKNLTRLGQISEELTHMPVGGMYSSPDLLPGETEEQRRVRLGYAASVGERRVQAGGQGDEQGPQLAISGLAESLKRLKSDIDALSPAIRKASEASQASIFQP